MARSVGVIGVPTSAGAFAPGQEQAPRALRDAGLLDALRGAGVEVRDHGDRELWRWRPDRERRRAQNVAKIVEIVRDTARRVADSASAGEVTLVLGAVGAAAAEPVPLDALRELAAAVGAKRASALAAELTGQPRNRLYRRLVADE